MASVNWDDKFGIIEDTAPCVWEKRGTCGVNLPDSECRCDKVYKAGCRDYQAIKEEDKMETENVVIEGVGKDAPIVTNAAGGKQSKSPVAMHLVDPYVLRALFRDKNARFYWAINHITSFMLYGTKEALLTALYHLDKKYAFYNEAGGAKLMFDIAKVLKEGAEKYEVNNWRLIPQEEHINHALIHLMAYIAGDKQDDHIGHCKCRLMMAYATEPSEGFSYTEYIKKTS